MLGARPLARILSKCICSHTVKVHLLARHSNSRFSRGADPSDDRVKLRLDLPGRRGDLDRICCYLDRHGDQTDPAFMQQCYFCKISKHYPLNICKGADRIFKFVSVIFDIYLHRNSILNQSVSNSFLSSDIKRWLIVYIYVRQTGSIYFLFFDSFLSILGYPLYCTN